MNIVFFDMDCLGNARNNRVNQPPNKEIKQLEYSLESFSKKIVGKNKIVNLQYKRFGRQALLSFDLVKSNEMLFMLYLLEYAEGGWKISKEYHYSKTILPVTAHIC